jgi:LPS-assembly protein
MSHNGFKFDNEFRYLTKSSIGTLQINFLPNDRGYKNFRLNKLAEHKFSNGDARIIGLKDNKQRYFMKVKHKTDFDKNWDFEIDYAKAGDDNYLYDFSYDLKTPTIMPVTSLGKFTEMQTNVNNTSITTISTTHLLQKGLLRYKNQYGNITTKFSQYQTLHPYEGPKSTEQYRMLPNIAGQFNNTFTNDINLAVQVDYTQFKFKENTNNIVKTVGKRYHTSPAISRPILEEPGIFLRPRVQLNTVNYSVKLSSEDIKNGKTSSPSSVIPMFDLDSGLVFERDVVINKYNMVQTLEPRAYFLYAPYKNQEKQPKFDSGPVTFSYTQLWRDNRYNGYDRVSEAKQISLGIMSRFETEAGIEKASIGIGRILYLQDRKNNGINEIIDNSTRWSPIAGIATYKINPYWNITANIVREKLNKSRTESLLAQYALSGNKVINFGYQFQRNEVINNRTKQASHTKQVNISFGWRIDQNIGLIGRLNYDIQQKRAMRILSGVEMHTCCTIVRVVWFKFLEASDTAIWKKYNHTIGAQLVFKGMGSNVGNMSYGKFTSEIPGYIPSDDEF